MNNKYRTEPNRKYGNPGSDERGEFGDYPAYKPRGRFDEDADSGDRHRSNYDNYNQTYDMPSRPPPSQPAPDYYRKGEASSFHKPRYGYGSGGEYDQKIEPETRDYTRSDHERSRPSRYENEASHDYSRRSERDYNDSRYSRRDDYHERDRYRDRSERERKSSHEGVHKTRGHHTRDEPYDRNRSERNSKMPASRSQRIDPEPPSHSTESNIIEDTVFVSNLPLDTTVSELASLFGSIGVLKIDKRTGIHRIKLYNHPDGKFKGEASISYEDCHAARAAIQWFNQSGLRGNNIKVQMAERTYSTSFINNRGVIPQYSGRGRASGYAASTSSERSGVGDSRNPPKPPFMQPGDWVCANCKNNNFSWRKTCNRCNTAKVENQSTDPNMYNPPPPSGRGGPPGYPPTHDPRSSDFKY